ncbi:hypothetical protein A0H81_12485 [Grifola frondosa]|uniref:Uncharacterized protein n=1 Tax=Grifola frondosa TaxID=5627 RepID=A0A1C7LXX7_GRIFR|nr:hypothetical protein A0H81_12485 [Grifola frondosa]
MKDGRGLRDGARECERVRAPRVVALDATRVIPRAVAREVGSASWRREAMLVRRPLFFSLVEPEMTLIAMSDLDAPASANEYGWSISPERGERGECGERVPKGEKELNEINETGRCGDCCCSACRRPGELGEDRRRSTVEWGLRLAHIVTRPASLTSRTHLGTSGDSFLDDFRADRPIPPFGGPPLETPLKDLSQRNCRFRKSQKSTSRRSE